MTKDERLLASERFKLVLDLFQAGMEMKRLSLRREHPDATEEEIEEQLGRWLGHRAGAEQGDCPGPRDWVSRSS
jgi:hypothetical protein